MRRKRVLLGLGGLLAAGCFEESPPVDTTTDPMCSTLPCGTSATTSGPGRESGDPPDGSSSSGASTGSSGPSADSSSGTPQGSSSSGPAGPICGDGELNQDSEMCDGTPGCLDDCTFENYACNPLNDAACVDGLRCGAIDVDQETFGCMPPGDAAQGQPCNGLPTNDGDCSAGLTCLFNFNTPLCDAGNCCVEYCDLTDPTFRCLEGSVCRPFFIGPMYQGLEHLGFCGEP